MLTLTLDTAEIILRAADGELVNDLASDAIRQEIDSFVSQLARQPSHRRRGSSTRRAPWPSPARRHADRPGGRMSFAIPKTMKDLNSLQTDA